MKISKSAIDQSIEYNPHLGQRYLDVLAYKHRFVTAICGRRFGKNYWLGRHEWQELIKPGGYVWHVAPIYSVAKIQWEQMMSWANKANAKGKKLFDINKSEMRIDTPWGGVFEAKSADNPTSLLGRGPTLIGLDEMARIPEVVYNEALRPTLMVSKGRVIGITTPKGKELAYKMYTWGQDPLRLEYASARFPSWINPLVTKDEVKQMYDTLPSDIFKQEVLATFVEDQGAVFRNIRACATASLIDAPIGGRTYGMAVDLAKRQDYTVIWVGDMQTKEAVYHERFNQISWPLQKQRIIEIARRFGARVIIDSTGVGDSIYDDLVNAGLNIMPFQFTSSSKNRIVENLSAAMDKLEFKYVSVPETITELDIFSYEIMPQTRRFRYNAPQGYHDDEVMALCLLNEIFSTPSYSFTFI